MRLSARALIAVAAGASLALSGCATNADSGAGAGAPPGKLDVVAAENFWGSIAAQLGGSKVAVKSIIVNPDTDPHSYEPTAADAVAFARSRLAIVNGIGYDRWASRLLAADSAGSGTSAGSPNSFGPTNPHAVLDVGRTLGRTEGDNPHQWYSPASVKAVIAQLVDDYKRLDPANAGYFDRQKTAFETQSLKRYDTLIGDIRAHYRGVPVGYSESIFEPLGRALGLDLATPYSFAKAIAEGSEVTAADKQAVDRQVQDHRIKVWVYNSQNATPDVQRVNRLAASAGIPITTITETLDPASASFQQWQVAELLRLRQALHQATGR